MTANKRGRGRPPKSSAKRRSVNMLVRLEPAEKQIFQEAADLAGLALSTWVRERLRIAVRHDFHSAGKPDPFGRTVDQFLEELTNESPKR
jgi:Mobilization protein NikA